MLKKSRDQLLTIVTNFTWLKRIIVQLNVNCSQLSIVSTTSATVCLAGSSISVPTKYHWCITLGSLHCYPYVRHIGRHSCVGIVSTQYTKNLLAWQVKYVG